MIMNREKNNSIQPSKLGRNILGIAIIIGLTILLIFWIQTSEPTAQRERQVKRTAMLVEVVDLQRANFTPFIEGLGNVQAAQDIVLRPQVSGRVSELASSFMPGQIIKKGSDLLKLDGADQRNIILQRESALQQAKAALQVELGQGSIAEQEYALLNKRIDDKNRSLILREPQLAAAHANVNAAKAALQQAQLDLQRTIIVAPFTAQVLSRNVNVGSQVNSGTDLARLVGTDEYWVVVTVPVSQLAQIAIPRQGEQGAQVILRDRTAWRVEQTRTGHLLGLMGALEAGTRLARLLVSVKDPLALTKDSQEPSLLIDSIVQAQVAGRVLNDVYRVERAHLHEGDTLWLKRDGKLAIEKATVVFKDSKYAYLSDGVKDGDQLIVSSIATVAPGVELRTESAKPAGGV